MSLAVDVTAMITARFFGLQRPIALPVAVAIALPFALAACGGRTTVGDDPDAGDEGGAVAALRDAGAYDPGGDASAFSTSQVQAALAQCGAAHGPTVAVSSASDEEALLPGAWVLCPGDAGTATVFSPGMILTPGGQWTRLASDGDGGLVATDGLQNQGTWVASCEASSSIASSQPCVFGGVSDVDVQIQAAGQDRSTDDCYGGSINFESSPRRMYVVDFPALYCDVSSTLATFNLWLVPL